VEIKRVGIYCRVSTKKQTVETQLIDLRRYSIARGWEIAVERCDEGWSGTKDKRPGLEDILQLANEGAYEALLVWKQDRLARSLPHLLATVTQLGSIGVALVSYKDGINTADDTPYTRFYLKMMASFAELEREMILERTNAGRERVFDERERTGKVITKTGNWFGRRALDVDSVIAEYDERFRRGAVTLGEIALAAGCSKPTACRRLKAFHNSPENVEFSFDERGVEI